MRFSHPEHAEEAGFDLTAMIDVVMLLVLFFAFTTQFTRTLNTPMDLPQEPGQSAKSGLATRAVVVDLTREGRTVIMGKAVDSDWLVQTLARDLRQAGGPEHLDVIVRADRRCAAAHLNALAGDLTRAGVRTWKLATAPEGGL
ncbi:MAG: hypothetical protein HBSAPP03_22140 [Phycisphaerae bacterium]|nr:MAG: hypothetical protein HBSAPP03_22140 [Phycisphaerae bacterium]